MTPKIRKILIAIIIVLIIAFLAIGLPRLLDKTHRKIVKEPEILAALGQKASFEIVKVFPHDPECYTQGLLFDEGLFYESCGLYGESWMRIANPETGETIGPPSCLRNILPKVWPC